MKVIETTKNISKYILLCFLLTLSISCNKDSSEGSASHNLTIFFTNDMHGSLDNFAKIKHIVDAEKELTNVMLVSAGDIFSGNPIVDQHAEKGLPIIDIMNKTGYDISVLGNHEFDYGVSILNDRMNQATFDWVCANVNTSSSTLEQPEAYVTQTIGDLKITFLGLVETNGKPDDVIPSTHPWRVSDLTFTKHQDVIADYVDLKEQEGADLLIALTHLGSFSDFELANEFSLFDAIIGGHSNDLNSGSVNGIPVVMAGTRLSHLGKMEMTVQNKRIVSTEITLIVLNEYDDFDQELAEVIEDYNDNPAFSEVVGFANSHHDRNEIGCFYTTALKEYLNVDFSIQNSGGIRSDIDQGNITRHEIFNMDPFNNGSVVFTFTAREVKDFFIQSGAGLHVSGITLERNGNDIIIRKNGVVVADNEQLTIGTNDFIPAVYDDYFSFNEADVKDLTTAETIIDYLKTINSTVDYDNCNRFFRY